MTGLSVARPVTAVVIDRIGSARAARASVVSAVSQQVDAQDQSDSCDQTCDTVPLPNWRLDILGKRG